MDSQANNRKRKVERDDHAVYVKQLFRNGFNSIPWNSIRQESDKQKNQNK